MRTQNVKDKSKRPCTTHTECPKRLAKRSVALAKRDTAAIRERIEQSRQNGGIPLGGKTAELRQLDQRQTRQREQLWQQL